MTSFLTEFNPLLSDLNNFKRNRLHLLHSDHKMKVVSPRNVNQNNLQIRQEFERNFVPFSISSDKKCTCWFNQHL